MKIKGIKRSQSIEFLEDISNVPDGTEVIVEFKISSNKIDETKHNLTDEDRLAKLNQLFGAWKDQPDLKQIFEEIDEQRHAYRGRVVDSMDNQDDR
ncbi:MAG: hypothetical protein KME29_00010 [Calothrix sp. FI2-JRJ7]|jgi:hypothetical protein|nr:hypothetical protein [Calothrix sp. FI2-JRJ7]